MSRLWFPSTFASARECLTPILSNSRALQHLVQLFDPKTSLVNTCHFPSAILYRRGATDSDLLASHNIFLPLAFDEEAGMAFVLNCGKRAMHTDKLEKADNADKTGRGDGDEDRDQNGYGNGNGTGAAKAEVDPSKTILSRTVVIVYKKCNIIYDATHYMDSTIGITCGFEDVYGRIHIYSFRFRKSNDGYFDLDHPFHTYYELGTPHCQFCHYIGKEFCTCSEQILERSKMPVNIKPLSSYANYVNWFRNRKPTISKIYVSDETGAIRFLEIKKPIPRKVVRVSGWDYIGPVFLSNIIPLEANLINDSFNPFLDTFRLQDNEDDGEGEGKFEGAQQQQQQQTQQAKEIKGTSLIVGACAVAVDGGIMDDDEDTQAMRAIATDGVISVSMLIEPDRGKSELFDWKEQYPDFERHNQVEDPHRTRNKMRKKAAIGECEHNLETSGERHGNYVIPKHFGRMETFESGVGAKLNELHTDELRYNDLHTNQLYTKELRTNALYEHQLKTITSDNGCSLCGRLLSSKRNLTKHLRTVHEKVKNLECSICGWKTHQKFNLERHQRVIHHIDI